MAYKQPRRSDLALLPGNDQKMDPAFVEKFHIGSFCSKSAQKKTGWKLSQNLNSRPPCCSRATRTRGCPPCRARSPSAPSPKPEWSGDCCDIATSSSLSHFRLEVGRITKVRIREYRLILQIRIWILLWIKESDP